MKSKGIVIDSELVDMLDKILGEGQYIEVGKKNGVVVIRSIEVSYEKYR